MRSKAEHISQYPVVSVICLCFNHKKHLRKTIESVFNQSYSNIELIIIDDASTDGSKEEIKKLIGSKNIAFLNLAQNLGNTSAFNKGFEIAQGKYIIDLAADDVLHRDRIEKQVKLFENCNEKVGVIYTDANYIDENDKEIGRHFRNSKINPHNGDVYQKLIESYFIPPPTMIIKTQVLIELNGYDETLAYEDFDFWIRSSRNWDYQYLPEALTSIRKTKNSLSSKAYSKNDQQLHSTFLICQKIKSLNKNKAEDTALIGRLKYEIKHAVLSGNFYEAKLFIELLQEMESLPVSIKILNMINEREIDLSFFRNVYRKLAY